MAFGLAAVDVVGVSRREHAHRLFRGVGSIQDAGVHGELGVWTGGAKLFMALGRGVQHNTLDAPHRTCNLCVLRG